MQDRAGCPRRSMISASGRTCCGRSCGCGPDVTNPITRDPYDAVTELTLPEAPLLASLRCGNPTALAELPHGEVVLDLGSGGGSTCC
jgi:arsenite methyltransferase